MSKQQKQVLIIVMIILFVVKVLSTGKDSSNSNNTDPEPTKISKEDTKKDEKDVKKDEKTDKKDETKNSNKTSNNSSKEKTKKAEKATKKPVVNNYKTLTVKVTAYCGCASCSGQWGTQTATGTTCVAGRTIAVDPSVIPLGSKVEIDGHTYIAEDVGGGVKGLHIDMYFDNHASTDAWGVRTKTVKVYN